MINISTSALKPSQYRKYVKGWDKGRYADIFAKYASDDNAYRFTLPLSKSIQRSTATPIAPLPIVKTELDKAGYVVDDYVSGYAVDSATGKRRMRIGRVLKSPEAINAFANDARRAGTKQADGQLVVVFSRHPYDIAGMSTDRGWSSCMNLIDGSNSHYVEQDVKHGSIIAYLVSKDDVNIRQPKARILMRVYKAGNRTGLFPASTYGTARPAFYATVSKWCSEVNTEFFKIPYGLTMKMLSSLYNDGDPKMTQLPLGDDPAANFREVLRSGHLPKRMTRANIHQDFRQVLLGILDNSTAVADEDEDSPGAAGHYLNNLSSLMEVAREERPAATKLVMPSLVELALGKLLCVRSAYSSALSLLRRESVVTLTTEIAKILATLHKMAAMPHPPEDEAENLLGMLHTKHAQAALLQMTTLPGCAYTLEEALKFSEDAAIVDAALSNRHSQYAGPATVLNNGFLTKEIANKITASFERNTNDYLVAEMCNYARHRITLKTFERRLGPSGMQRILAMHESSLPIRTTRAFEGYVRALVAKPDVIKGTMADAANVDALEKMYTVVMLGAGNRAMVAISRIAACIHREGYKAADYLAAITETAKTDVRAVRHDTMLKIASNLTKVEQSGLFDIMSGLFGSPRGGELENTPAFKRMAKAMREIMLTSIATPEQAAATIVTLANRGEAESFFPPYSAKALDTLPYPFAPHYLMTLPCVTGADGLLSDATQGTLRGSLSSAKRQAKPELAILGYMGRMCSEISDYGHIAYVEEMMTRALLDIIANDARWEELRSGLAAFTDMLPVNVRKKIERFNFVTYMEDAFRRMLVRFESDALIEQDASVDIRLRALVMRSLRRSGIRNPQPAAIDRYVAAIMRVGKRG